MRHQMTRTSAFARLSRMITRSDRSFGLASVAGAALALAPCSPTLAGGNGLPLGDGSNTVQNRARIAPTLTRLGVLINADRRRAGMPVLAGAALSTAAATALTNMRCHAELLAELAAEELDDRGLEGSDKWDEMFDNGRVCVIERGPQGQCYTDCPNSAVPERRFDRINININYLPYDQKFNTLGALLAARPQSLTAGLIINEEIRHALQNFKVPTEDTNGNGMLDPGEDTDGDGMLDMGESRRVRTARRQLLFACNELESDQTEIAVTCDMLNGIDALEAGNAYNATTDFGEKVLDFLNAVMDDPNTAGVNERQQAINAVKMQVLTEKRFTGAVGDANMNGMLDTKEDRNGNGMLDPGEDFNGNGVLDTAPATGDEDIDRDGVLDDPGTSVCYSKVKTAIQAYLASPRGAADLRTLNRALAMVRWNIPSKRRILRPVDPTATIPASVVDRYYFPGGTRDILQIPGDKPAQVLETTFLGGIRDVLVVDAQLEFGDPVPVMLVAGDVGFGEGTAITLYFDPDDDGCFNPETEQFLTFQPSFLDVIQLLLPLDAPLDQLLVGLRDTLNPEGDQVFVAPLADSNGDGFPDQLLPPITPLMNDDMFVQSFLLRDDGGIEARAEPTNTSANDASIRNFAFDKGGDPQQLDVVVPAFAFELDQYAPFPAQPLVDPADVIVIASPPGTPVAMYQLDPLGIKPTFTEQGEPLIPPIAEDVVPNGQNFVEIPLPVLPKPIVLVARNVETGALSHDIFVTTTATPCNDADLGAPFGVLDIADVVAFLQLFSTGDAAADLAAPFGTLDIADVVAFLQVFGAGCP